MSPINDFPQPSRSTGDNNSLVSSHYQKGIEYYTFIVY